MPIYEYQCQSCGFDLEKLQRINDEPLLECPKCGKPELVRLVSASGFRLKGAGWYETDFKKSGKKNLHDGGSSSDAKTADKTEDKPATKPAETTKPEPKPAASKPSAD
ncbi:MAG: zinc ribbon domain-containing protein [Xanthomonadales bacterium]|nr:zinc ribbon domain-containing protein [Xanthomonadales bacterium]